MTEGHKGTVVFENAEVEMPILSGNKIAKQQNELKFREHAGECLHLPTGRISRLFALYGVYFIWLHVDSQLLTHPNLDEGFVRQGI